MKFQRRAQFYETDAMGIIHHGNHVLYMEEARIHWLRQQKFFSEGSFFEQYNFPVLHCHVEYKSPIYFDDEIQIELEVRALGAKIDFSYVLRTNRFEKAVAFGKTSHALMDMKTRRAVRLPLWLLDALS